MQPIIERTPQGLGIHVLIVSVGRYEAAGMDTVIGSSRTAHALYDFWRIKADDNDRRIDGQGVGSIQMLAVGDDDASFPILDDDGGALTLVEPTVLNVRSAFESWMDRVSAGGIGVIHWMGHGAQIGRRGNGPVNLFCSDADSKGDPNGIDWDQTETQIRGKADGNPVACFIDACRCPDVDATYPAALSGQLRPASGIFVHFATAANGSALVHPAIDDVDFPGGPVFTNAVIDAFDRYGGSTQGSQTHPVADPDSIGMAVERRASRIHGWARLEKRKRGERRNAGWSAGGFTRVPEPQCMVDVMPPKGMSSGQLQCLITKAGAAQQQVVASLCVQASVGWGQCRLEFPDGQPSRWNQDLNLNGARRKVELEGPGA